MTKFGRILCLTRKLNIRKACGYDSISPRMLRLASSGIADSLTKLFNECIRKGEWPEAWKKGEWNPVHKKDDRLDERNYRPITVDKAFESIMSIQVNKTLWERIFGRDRTTGSIIWTRLIAAKELSSYLTREDKSFTPLICWTTQLIQYVPIHNNNRVISWQCLKICTSSMQTCLEPNCNIGHKVVTARRIRFISAPLILTLWGRLTDRWVFIPIALYSVFRLLTRANKVPEVQYPQGLIRE